MSERASVSQEPARTARAVIEALRIRAPSELEVDLIAAHHGAMTLFRPLLREEGRLVRRGARGIIVVALPLADTPRARFVIAHELGHFLLHAGRDQFFLCTTADLSDYRKSGMEAEANRFAAELLMPEPWFAPQCTRARPCLDDLKELSHTFRTSLMATAIRFADFASEPFAAVVSRDAKVQFSVRSQSFPYFVPRGRRIRAESLASRLHDGRTAPEPPGMVEASAWSSVRAATDRELLEHSMRLGETGLVLTTLWSPP